MDTTTRPTSLIRWELCWTPCEMAGVALGLLFGIGFDNWSIGSPILLGVLALSFIVRFQHYTSVSERSRPA